MPTKQKPKTTTKPAHAKRTAKHHKTSKQYLKVYWPYVPIFLVMIAGLFLGNFTRAQNSASVLAYATEISNNELLNATNERRQQHGKQNLKLNKALSDAAQAKAQDMAERNYWSHIAPDGTPPWEFIDKTGYTYAKAGENLAYGFATSSETVTGWMNSQSHRENMLDDAYIDVGFGLVNSANYNNAGKATIVVAMYAQPSSLMNQTTANSDQQGAGFTSLSSAEPQTQAITWIQNITNGNTPWIAFVTGMAMGSLLLLVVIRHGVAFKRALVHGEEFILHHPIIDIAVVAVIMLGYVLSQSTGFIR